MFCLRPVIKEVDERKSFDITPAREDIFHLYERQKISSDLHSQLACYMFWWQIFGYFIVLCWIYVTYIYLYLTEYTLHKTWDCCYCLFYIQLGFESSFCPPPSHLPPLPIPVSLVIVSLGVSLCRVSYFLEFTGVSWSL